jgi:hypothetical protein
MPTFASLEVLPAEAKPLFPLSPLEPELMEAMGFSRNLGIQKIRDEKCPDRGGILEMTRNKPSFPSSVNERR